MKITLKREDVYTLTINDTVFPGMRKKSDWNGFVELEGPKGVAILSNNRGLLSNALDDILGSERTDWILIKASVDILAAQKK